MFCPLKWAVRKGIDLSLDLLFGKPDDFEYISTTTPLPPGVTHAKPQP